MPEKKRTITDALNELVNNDPNGLKPQINSKAPLNSPALTGTPTAPTPAEGDNSTKLATTAFVNNIVGKLLSFADEDLDTFVEVINEIKKMRSSKTSTANYGLVKVGSNISVTDGTISLTKANVTSALGYTPPETAGNSVTLLGTTGSSTTNGMTQSAITNALNDKLNKTDAANTYLGKSTAATSSTFGAVKIGSNITNSSGTISLTKSNVTSALGYTPPTQDTVTTLASGTGTSTTQGMTQKAITDALNNKAQIETSQAGTKDYKTINFTHLNKSSNNQRISMGVTGNNMYIENIGDDCYEAFSVTPTFAELVFRPASGTTTYTFKADGIYLGNTKITN